MPLSSKGLCDAEITIPASKPLAAVMYAIAGVGMTSAVVIVAPSDPAPRASSRSIHVPDSRVSRPMTNRGACPDLSAGSSHPEPSRGVSERSESKGASHGRAPHPAVRRWRGRGVLARPAAHAISTKKALRAHRMVTSTTVGVTAPMPNAWDGSTWTRSLYCPGPRPVRSTNASIASGLAAASASRCPRIVTRATAGTTRGAASPVPRLRHRTGTPTTSRSTGAGVISTVTFAVCGFTSRTDESVTPIATMSVTRSFLPVTSIGSVVASADLPHVAFRPLDIDHRRIRRDAADDESWRGIAVGHRNDRHRPSRRFLQLQRQ